MRFLVAVALFMVALPAVAQVNVNDIPSSIAATTTSGNCLAADPNRTSLTIDNTANTVNVGYCEFAPAGSSCTAAIGAGGTTTLAGGLLDYWPAKASPKNGFCFISASGTQTITIRQGY